MGLVGDDELARFLSGSATRVRAPRCAPRGPGGATMSVDAFNVATNGRRTHFTTRGGG
jgi:hypothetical protein